MEDSASPALPAVRSQKQSVRMEVGLIALGVPLPGWVSALSTGAAVSTILGLLGLVAVCIFLAYLARLRSETKRLPRLPPDERTKKIDTYTTSYPIDLRDLPPKAKLALVERDMNLRWRWHLILGLLIAGVFVFCITVVAFIPSPRAQEIQGQHRTTADDLVIEYMREVENLRGEFEAKNHGWQLHVRQEGKRLADLIDQVSKDELHTARKIIQPEYKGWALLLVARTFGEPTEHEEEAKGQRIQYAKQAVHEFDSALGMMEEVALRFRYGDKDAAALYEWMTGESADLERSHYLKAVALAVMARNGDPNTKVKDVHDELTRVSSDFLRTYPPEDNPDLEWALVQVKGKTPA